MTTSTREGFSAKKKYSDLPERGLNKNNSGSVYPFLKNPPQVDSIVTDDRMKWTAAKVQRTIGNTIVCFPLCNEWEKSIGLKVKEFRSFTDRNGRECESRIFGWNPAIFNTFPDLQGTRLEIAGNSISIELHNILNRYPKKSRLQIFINILDIMQKLVIIKPGSISSYYRITRKFFKVKEYEIRFDFLPYLLSRNSFNDLKGIALDNVDTTLYFTSRSTEGMRMRFYPYSDFYRFEIIFQSGNRKNGSAKKLIDMKRIYRNINRRHELASLIIPIIQKAVFIEDLDIDGEELFEFSQPLNQWSEKRC